MASLSQVELTIVLGKYAIGWHLPEARKQTLTEVVADWRTHWPERLALPHPSPRNNLWLRRNSWVESEIIPLLRKRVAKIL